MYYFVYEQAVAWLNGFFVSKAMAMYMTELSRLLFPVR